MLHNDEVKRNNSNEQHLLFCMIHMHAIVKQTFVFPKYFCCFYISKLFSNSYILLHRRFKGSQEIPQMLAIYSLAFKNGFQEVVAIRNTCFSSSRCQYNPSKQSIDYRILQGAHQGLNTMVLKVPINSLQTRYSVFSTYNTLSSCPIFGQLILICDMCPIV